LVTHERHRVWEHSSRTALLVRALKQTEHSSADDGDMIVEATRSSTTKFQK